MPRFLRARTLTLDPGEEGQTHTLVEADRERASCWTRDYLLRHCLGYRVEFPAGPPGVVEDVILDPDRGELLALEVRRGGGPCDLVPVEQVRDLLPGTERIVVGPALDRAAGSEEENAARSPFHHVRRG